MVLKAVCVCLERYVIIAFVGIVRWFLYSFSVGMSIVWREESASLCK
jgi:hypothetical protein